MSGYGPPEDIPATDVRIHGFFNDRTEPELKKLLEEFYRVTDIEPHPIFTKAIYLAQDPNNFENNTVPEENLILTQKEKKALTLDREPIRTSGRQHRLRPQFQTNSISNYRKLPWPLWKLILLCAVGASVQGWDQAAVNGAQIWYQAAFQIYIDTSSIPRAPNDTSPISSPDPNLRPQPSIVGLVNGAPYLCCVLSCMLTPWLNKKLGRRGTIFWCALFSAAFAFAQAFAQSWQQLLAYRLLMGLGIGPKSATVPIYAAECAPANIRGSLVMFWQVWTAVGIAAGSIAGAVLQPLGQASNDNLCPRKNPQELLQWRCSENWRLVLASPTILPCFLALYIYGCSESPRWTIAKAHSLRNNGRLERARLFYKKAYKDLTELSRDRLLAARDTLFHYYLLEKENDEVVRDQDRRPSWSWPRRELHELFFNRRNARAIMASTLVMFAQQFCGVNFLIYYSSEAFLRMNLNGRAIRDLDQGTFIMALRESLWFTAGFGIGNLVFAIPAFFTIDTVGRRTLLLVTFPLLAISQAISAIGARYCTPVALFGVMLFDLFYSPGEGPVPFVYAAESMPLHIRVKGMSFVTGVNWLFNFVIAFTGPHLLALDESSTWAPFAWYCAWCVILWFAILLLVPETRLLILEELDFVFRELSAKDFATHSFKEFLWHVHLRDERPTRIWDQIEEQDRQRRRERRHPYNRSNPSNGDIGLGGIVTEHKRPVLIQQADSESDIPV